MKSKKRFYLLPKTRIGKISLWMVVIALVIISTQYWIALLTGDNCVEEGCARGILVMIRIILLWLMLAGLCIGGITSIISLVKHRDFALLLFLTALFGLFGLMFVLGEFLFPH